MRSIHDNNIYAYTVACEQKRIVLHTEGYLEGDVREFTDVVFNGVIAHQFENQLPGNILFGIEEGDIAEIIRAKADLFEQGRRYGWPEINAQTNDELARVLVESGIKTYEISSSYGLSGWVAA